MEGIKWRGEKREQGCEEETEKIEEKRGIENKRRRIPPTITIPLPLRLKVSISPPN